MNFTDKKVHILNVVDSTNNYANDLIVSDTADEGTVVLARFQKSGKGQSGNSWESEYDKNLLMSLVLFPYFLEAAKQFYLSKIISLSIIDVLKEHVEGVSIKWPNDIYVNDKKVAGILIENGIKDRHLDYAVIGLGLNLNQEKFNSDAPNPVSLCHLTDKYFETEFMAKKIRKRFWFWYEILKQNNFQKIDAIYLRQLYRYGQDHLFKKEGEIFEARIVGIGEFGQLQLQKKSGEKEEFLFKEVEFVLK